MFYSMKFITKKQCSCTGKACLLAVVILVEGCQVLMPRNDSLGTEEDAMADPVLPQALLTADSPSPGSLYTSSSMQLFNDRKAHRVGDILTVMLEELTSSSKKADTVMDKNSSVSMPTPTLLGETPNRPLNTSISGSRSFNGKAKTDQQNRLTGSITVVVEKVLAGGALFVRGSKVVRLNQGDEIIYVSGIVRPEDVTQDNLVSSRRLAQAKISYTGKGDIAETNTMGWLTRLLNSEWFPF